MIADQAQALRGMVAQQGAQPQTRPAGPRARTLAITSGKGGVGKTTLSVNLAVSLARRGRGVVLLDADLGTANADVLCNLSPSGNLGHVVAGRKSLSEALVEAPGGFRLIPGASGLSQMAALSASERGRLIEQLQRLESEAELLMVDTGAGVGPNVLSFCAAADEVLVVTTPEPTAITDAYALIKTLVREKPDADISILVNEVRGEAEACDVHQRIAAVCRRFLEIDPKMGGFVVRDARVPLSVRRRRPLLLDCPACQAGQGIEHIARHIERDLRRRVGGGVFRRLAHWLGA
ncbi:MAG: MinD/ParA family protein [Phycisphaeraceae bacterium]